MPAPTRTRPATTVATAAVFAAAVCLAATVAAAATITGKIDRFAFEPTGTGTWLLIASDTRHGIPPGAPADAYHDGTAIPDRGHADIIVAVTPGAPTPVLTIPRELLVTGTGTRLGDTWAASPDTLTAALCAVYDLGVEGIVEVDFATVAAIVDAHGHYPLTLTHRYRDPTVGLDLPAGTHHLDGHTTVAWLRSRTGQHHIDGTWHDAHTGPGERPGNAATALAELTPTVRDALTRPARTWKTATAAAAHLRASDTVGPVTLTRLAATARQTAVPVPVDHSPHDITVAYPTPDRPAELTNTARCTR